MTGGSLCLCVRVCVRVFMCVCRWERERKNQGQKADWHRDGGFQVGTGGSFIPFECQVWSCVIPCLGRRVITCSSSVVREYSSSSGPMSRIQQWRGSVRRRGIKRKYWVTLFCSKIASPTCSIHIAIYQTSYLPSLDEGHLPDGGDSLRSAPFV